MLAAAVEAVRGVETVKADEVEAEAAAPEGQKVTVLSIKVLAVLLARAARRWPTTLEAAEAQLFCWSSPRSHRPGALRRV